MRVLGEQALTMDKYTSSDRLFLLIHAKSGNLMRFGIVKKVAKAVSPVIRMNVAFAFLLEKAVHNYMRKLAHEVNIKYHTGLIACQVPAHVSLKQPFAVSDLDRIEAYFDTLGASIKPFAMDLPRVALSEDRSVLWLEVAETIALRGLHNRLNHELTEQFGATNAQCDGDDYRFHATIAQLSQATGASMELNQEKWLNSPVGFRSRVTELAMFYNKSSNARTGQFTTYKIVSLGGS